MPESRTALAAIFLLASTTACMDATPPDTGDLAAQVDTIAGVITTTNPDVAPESWRFELISEFGELGGDGPPQPEVFGSIASITADEDGRVYVADSQALEIRVFSESGEYLQTIGGEGQGPGEFGALYSVHWLADTLYALDPGNARIQRFVDGGTDAGSLAWLPLTGSPNEIRLHPTADDLLHVTTLPPRVAGGIQRGRAFLSFDGDARTDSIFVPYDPERPRATIVCTSPEVITFYSSPLQTSESVVPAGAGTAWHYWTDAYDLDLVDIAGDTVRRILRRSPTQPVPDSIWAAVEDSMAAFLDRQPSGRPCEPSSLPRPEVMPVVAGVHYTAEGDLVVEAESDSGHRFDFYDEDGRLVASAVAPARNSRTPPHFRGDRLYVATLGELDVPGVAVYRLVREE